jgi:hypothetical protein
LSSQDEFEADILGKHEDLDDVAETLEQVMIDCSNAAASES